MNGELLPYYERELLFVRKMASEFAQQYPQRAAALRLTHSGCDDPHVERIIEAFALIAGRIQRKIDEEFPEITQALLDMLYPHFLRPVPSMAIAQFEVDAEQSKSPTGHAVPRGAIAYSEPVGGVQCRFRSAYPVRLFPIRVASATFSRASIIPGGISSPTAQYAIRIELETQGAMKFSGLQLRDLRFHIGGDRQAAYWLYELLFNNVSQILVRYQEKDGKRHSVQLVSRSIVEVGFRRDQAMLPYNETSFQGYRLLQEYFFFPEKFLFFDITGLDQIALPPTHRLEVVILLDDFQRAERAMLLESAVGAETFQLGCTPVVNLFDHCAEPIRVSHARPEYPVVPDIHAPFGMEVYSVNRVVSVTPYSEQPKEYCPFYSLRHDEDSAAEKAYWYATRRASERNGDSGTDVYLSLVDHNFKPTLPATESITAYLTCTNRNLPEQLGLSGRWGELDLESSAIVKARVVDGPTSCVRPPLRKGLQWRLISHLSLNHLSLVEGGVEALREILRLYQNGANASAASHIAGLVSLRSSRKIARLDSEYGAVFSQGIAIDTEFDEEQFAGSGAFLLACILERFFGLYSAVNSFTQLRVSTRQRKGVVWVWPPRTGEQIVA